MGKQSTHAPVRSAGVVGMARRKGDAGNGGDPSDRRSRLHRRRWRRIGRESDRGVVPLKPGNSGGGKAPDFWCAFEAAVPILAHSVPLAVVVLLLFPRSLLSTPGNVAKFTLLPSLADLAGVGRQAANTLYQLAPRLALIAGPAVASIAPSAPHILTEQFAIVRVRRSLPSLQISFEAEKI